MKAIGYTLAGNADVLREFSIEKPVPGVRLENGKYPTLRPFLKQT
ncbi:TPA: hypothetical protein ACPZDH_004099 [Yersinia enterocolitica]|nr:hypothetical protein [Yersinia enterocolitica]CQQ28120.1 Uncharacterised protein [Yersinia enterocolitica]CRX42342.1 Uncharacterised protein [Yersinia enterocolitica]